MTSEREQAGTKPTVWLGALAGVLLLLIPLTKLLRCGSLRYDVI
jgi:hypothetical protein